VRIAGTGFPEGRPATVTLKGELLRAGEAPRRDAALTLTARRVAPHALEFAFTPELAQRLCGNTDARHTTFRGDVEVLFSSQSSLRGGVTGRLEGVVLDAAPEARAEVALATLSAEGERFAEFLGVSLVAAPQGLQIAAVRPGSRATRAHLAIGDVVRELEGMAVRNAADFIPPPNARVSRIKVLRGPDEMSLLVDSMGFRYSSPQTLTPSLVLFVFGLSVFLLLYSPLGRGLSRLERRLLTRVFEMRQQQSGSTEPRRAARPPAEDSLPQAIWRGFLAQLPDSFLPYLAFVTVSASLSLSALGKSVLLADVDLFALPAASLIACVLTALTAGPKPYLREGLVRALSVACLNLPWFALALAVAWSSGSLRPTEVVATQGPWPWQWSAFQNPLIGLLTIACIVAQVPKARPVSPFGDTGARGGRALSLAASVHALTTSGFLSLVAFGGHALPWEARGLGLQALGALCVLSKAWSVLGVIWLLRWCVGDVDAVTVRRSALYILAIPSWFVALGVILGSRFVHGPVLAALAHATAPALFGGALLTLGVMVYRIQRGIRAAVADTGIQPWL